MVAFEELFFPPKKQKLFPPSLHSSVLPFMSMSLSCRQVIIVIKIVEIRDRKKERNISARCMKSSGELSLPVLLSE